MQFTYIIWSCTNSTGDSGYWIGASNGVEAGNDVRISRDIDIDSAVNEDGKAGIGDSIAIMYKQAIVICDHL